MKTRFLLPVLAGALALACSEIDPLGPDETVPPGDATITTDITSDRLFHAETTYTLSGFIKVANEWRHAFLLKADALITSITIE